MGGQTYYFNLILHDKINNFVLKNTIVMNKLFIKLTRIKLLLFYINILTRFEIK